MNRIGSSSLSCGHIRTGNSFIHLHRIMPIAASGFMYDICNIIKRVNSSHTNRKASQVY